MQILFFCVVFLLFKRTNITNINIENYLVSFYSSTPYWSFQVLFSHAKYNQDLKQLTI